MEALSQPPWSERPYIYDFPEPADFLRALAAYHKQNTRAFSLRQQALRAKNCSPALVSLLLSGQRKIRRDHLGALTKILLLQPFEAAHIDRLVSEPTREVSGAPRAEKKRGRRQPQNHLFRDWVNVYVKDCCQLRNFLPEPRRISQLLGGLVNERRIARAIDFLLAQGFWRYDTRGRIVPNEALVVSTHDIPNDQIREMHARALKLASRGLQEIPSSRRMASTVVLTVNQNSLAELRNLITKFQQELFDFVEEHPNGNEQLCQVVMHMTPMGGKNDA